MSEHPFLLDPAIQTMEARAVDRLPSGPGWQYEPKWDGFRCVALKGSGRVELRARSGKSLSRFFPEMVAALERAPAERFVLDGELAIPLGDTLSFAALQDRLHPAESRVRRLAAETPSLLILFDCLADDGRSLVEAPLVQRRAALEAIFGSVGPSARLTPFTHERKTAQLWLDHSQGALDGVVAKRIDEPYLPGERAMLKVKRMRTADCVVGGFRYRCNSREVASLLLGLYNSDGLLDHVGFTSSIAASERHALTDKLEALVGGPGFTGDAPGGPSRWSTERSSDWERLHPALVVEVQYDHATGGRFRHGTTLLRWRPDKAPSQCTMEQMQEEMRPAALIRQVLQQARA